MDGSIAQCFTSKIACGRGDRSDGNGAVFIESIFRDIPRAFAQVGSACFSEASGYESAPSACGLRRNGYFREALPEFSDFVVVYLIPSHLVEGRRLARGKGSSASGDDFA